MYGDDHNELALQGYNPGPHRILSRIGQRENGGTCDIEVPAAPAATVLSLEESLIQLSSENTDAPETLTLTLFRVPENPEAFDTTNTGVCYARIRWGAGKTMQEAIVDFHHGARFTMDASSVEVSAIYESWNGVAALVGPTMRFSCSLVYGNIGSKLMTFTQRVALLAGGTEDVAIPNFAGRLTSFGGGPVPASAQWRVNKATALGTATSLPDGNTIQIPNGAEFMTFVNNDVASHIYNLIWGLNL